MKPTYRYTAARATLHSIPTGRHALVEVVGDPDNACYEWQIRDACTDQVTHHSDDGYGSPEVALRDGLIAYLGLPRVVDGEFTGQSLDVCTVTRIVTSDQL